VTGVQTCALPILRRRSWIALRSSADSAGVLRGVASVGRGVVEPAAATHCGSVSGGGKRRGVTPGRAPRTGTEWMGVPKVDDGCWDVMTDPRARLTAVSS